MQHPILCAFLAMLTLTGFPLSAQDSQGHSEAKTKTVPTIDGKLFVSCEVEAAAVMAGNSSTFTLKNGSAHIVNEEFFDNKSEEKTVKLTPEEMNRFLHLIEAAHFFTLKPSYSEKGLFDAGLVKTTLKVSSNGKERIYTVSVYGSTAPKPYYEFQKAVWAFMDKNLPLKRH